MRPLAVNCWYDKACCTNHAADAVLVGVEPNGGGEQLVVVVSSVPAKLR
jgi:hypothetical protein